MIRTAAAAALVATFAALPALAAPFGGAQVIDAQVQAQAPRGYRMPPPTLIADAGGVRVHGVVCRTSLTAAPAPRSVRIEQLDGAGRVTASSSAFLTGNLSGRPGPGCAYYDLQAQAPQSGDSLRVAAVS